MQAFNRRWPLTALSSLALGGPACWSAIADAAQASVVVARIAELDIDPRKWSSR